MKKRYVLSVALLTSFSCFASALKTELPPPEMVVVPSADAYPAEQTELLLRLLKRDSHYLPAARWGSLYVTPLQADDDFLVVRISGYTSGRDANTVFVYRSSDEDWRLSCILEVEDLGRARLLLEDLGEGELQVSLLPQLGKSSQLPYIHSFTLPELQGKVPRYIVTPRGVSDDYTYPEQKSVPVYMRLKMSEPLNMYMVSMDTDATSESVSLETVLYEDGVESEFGGEHLDDVYIGDKPFDAEAFFSRVREDGCLQEHQLPREAIQPGSIEIGWAYDSARSEWVLLLRHENGRTWCYDSEQKRFVPSELKETDFTWKE